MRRLPTLLMCMLAVVTLLGYYNDLKPQPQPRREKLIEIDELSPVVDSIDCPPVMPPAIGGWHYTIYAHDEARFAQLATPAEFLEYSYVFTQPPPAFPIPSVPEWSVDNKLFEAYWDGLAYPGEYSFVCRVRDSAGNISDEMGCGFEVP